jgi:hypothetical protein
MLQSHRVQQGVRWLQDNGSWQHVRKGRVPALQACFRPHILHIGAAQEAVPGTADAAAAEEVAASNPNGIMEQRLAPVRRVSHLPFAGIMGREAIA